MSVAPPPDPIHLPRERNGSAIRTRCGLILELPPGRDLPSIGIGGINTATCPQCLHPSTHP